MKKHFSLFIILSLLLFTFTSCGSNVSIAGKWVGEAMIIDGERITLNDMADVTLDITSDGQLVYKFEDNISKGKWNFDTEDERTRDYKVEWDNGGSTVLMEVVEDSVIENAGHPILGLLIFYGEGEMAQIVFIPE